MIFITDADITDDVLVVDQSDIDAANAYVGSMQAKFAIADEDIADPLPYNIRRLAIVYACYTAALLLSGALKREELSWLFSLLRPQKPKNSK